MGSLYRRKQKLQDGSEREIAVHKNSGLRKICRCPRRQWAKCPHDSHFNFKPKGGLSFSSV